MHKPLMDTEWFKAQKKLSGATDADLAAVLGVERSVANKVVNGAVEFNAKRAEAVAELLDAAVDEVLFRAGILSQRFSVPESAALPANDDDIVEIDSVDLAYGFGGAFLDADVEVDKVKVSQAWLQRFTNAPPSRLGIAEGIGDSMEPLFYDRDLVVFDRSALLNDHMSDKTWVFTFGQVGMVKRLRPMPDGTIKIMSVNRSYPDEIAAPGEIHIIGRVVASIRRH